MDTISFTFATYEQNNEIFVEDSPVLLNEPVVILSSEDTCSAAENFVAFM